LTETETVNPDELPFVAPCRDLETFAPIDWVRKGLADLRKAPLPAAVYGVISTMLIAVICVLAWGCGSYRFLFAMLVGFVFLAPVACIGLYSDQRADRTGRARINASHISCGRTALYRQ